MEQTYSTDRARWSVPSNRRSTFRTSSAPRVRSLRINTPRSVNNEHYDQKLCKESGLEGIENTSDAMMREREREKETGNGWTP